MSIVEIPFEADPVRPDKDSEFLLVATAEGRGALRMLGLKTEHPIDHILSLKIGGSPELLWHQVPHLPPRPMPDGVTVGLLANPLLLHPNQAVLRIRVDPGTPPPHVWLVCGAASLPFS